MKHIPAALEHVVDRLTENFYASGGENWHRVKMLLSSNTSWWLHALHERFPDSVGNLISPGGWRECPFSYALDNGAFGAFKNGEVFDETAYRKLIDSALKAPNQPDWIVVPDVVANKQQTLENWWQWEPELRSLKWPLAFAVQDGMGPEDVPVGADVIFVGGTTRWKDATIPIWCNNFPRVHVARVNGMARLWAAHKGFAMSVDGTGWLRGDRQQLQNLLDYFAITEGTMCEPIQLCLW